MVHNAPAPKPRGPTTPSTDDRYRTTLVRHLTVLRYYTLFGKSTPSVSQFCRIPTRRPSHSAIPELRNSGSPDLRLPVPAYPLNTIAGSSRTTFQMLIIEERITMIVTAPPTTMSVSGRSRNASADFLLMASKRDASPTPIP